MDFQKKDWQFRDLITEGELNRMEDGIEEGITKAEQAQQTATDAQTNLDSHVSATTGVHGATSEATPNTLVQRDPAGRFKAAAPVEDDDVARKAEVDAVGQASLPISGGTMTGQLNILDHGVYPDIGADKSASDPPDTYPLGLSILHLNNGLVNGWPTEFGIALTFIARYGAGNRLVQLFIPKASEKVYVRNATNDGTSWRPFVSVATDDNYVRVPGYAATSGSANNYTVTLDPAPTSYTDGMCLAVKVNTTNTGASTLNVNGLGARSIKKPNGNDVAAGSLRAGSIYTLRYNATTGNFILQGEGGSGDAQPSDVLSGKTFTNDAGEQVGTMPNRTGHVTGQSISRSGTTLRIRPQEGYYPGDSGNSVAWNDPNWIAANIREGVSIFGLVGTLVEGKPFASGTAPVSGGSATVSGLAFSPTLIVVLSGVASSYGYFVYSSSPYRNAGVDTGNNTRSNVFSVTSNGFTITAQLSSTIAWYAFGD